MRSLCFAIVFAFASVAGAFAADEREVFYGIWGTEEQCARAPLLPGGTVMAEPFEISADGLRHGRVWCLLNWFPIERREDGFFSGARALCGEDSIRDYMIGMSISGESLTLRWDFPLIGPLHRCPNA